MIKKYFSFSDLFWAKFQFYKRFYIYFLHNMFGRLAPCPRGGLQQTKDEESESGNKILVNNLVFLSFF